MRETIEVGDLVVPITKAGLQLTTMPLNGKYDQEGYVSCVFKGVGKVLEVRDVVVDYDSWPDSLYDGVGKITIRSCLIKCNSGIGWGSGIKKFENTGG
jgi:hypothetical protein